MPRIALLLSLLPAALLSQTPAPIWPTAGWTAATPESIGARGDALAAIDRDIKADVYGLVDRLFVTYKGRAIANYRYERDYRAISKGRMSCASYRMDGVSGGKRVHSAYERET